MAVYSPDRVMRLRMVLWIVVALGLLMALFAVTLLAGGEEDNRVAGVLAVVVAGLFLGSAGFALRALDQEPGRRAKVAAVVTGAVVVLSGLALVGTWLAFLLPMLGLGLLFLALVADDEAGAGR